MNVYPLISLTLEQAIQKQFKLVDAAMKEIEGVNFLNLGDLGVHPFGNIPHTTRKVEKALARFFEQEDSVFVRGAGTGAIREALASVLKSSETLLVHTAPVYSTTLNSIEQLGLNVLTCDFNNLQEVEDTLKIHPEIKCVLIQYTRQELNDSYDMKSLIHRIKAVRNVAIVTDDNYAVMKVDKIGVELGADLSCFSCFKLLGPEGVGLVVGKKGCIDTIHNYHYSGGSQTQGFEAMEALRGLVFAPVTHAIQALECEKIVAEISKSKIEGIDKALIVNAQSKVVLVRLSKGNAKEVLEVAQTMGAAPYPIGAESKYEIAPMFYRVSGTMRAKNPDFETHWIRINPMRSGSQTVLRVLEAAIKKVK